MGNPLGELLRSVAEAVRESKEPQFQDAQWLSKAATRQLLRHDSLAEVLAVLTQPGLQARQSARQSCPPLPSAPAVV